MAEVINLSHLDIRSKAIALEQANRAIKSGEVIVAPLEHSYVYLCDAFSHEAVMRIHELRGAAPGISTQVLIGSAKTLVGIAQYVSDQVQDLVSKFWPGLLTINLQPNFSLNWNLGDGATLDHFAVRVPSSGFVLELLQESGPLAVAAATTSGNKLPLALDEISALPSEIELYFDGGEIEPGPLSTVIQVNRGTLEINRLGAISIAQLREVIPEIALKAE